MKWKRRDIGNLITALELAICFRKSLINAEAPRFPRNEWEQCDIDKIDGWKLDIKIFTKLVRRLALLESK